MAVPRVSKPKREDPRMPYPNPKKKDSNKFFSQVLKEAVQEEAVQEPAPRVCSTTTYGRDSKLQNFRYVSREYHY